jgi:hypothetical protein
LALGATAGLLAATMLAGVAESAPPSDLPPSEEIPVQPRLLPSSDALHPQGIPASPEAASPPMTTSLPSDGSSAQLRSNFRDRWHYCMQSHLWGFPSQFQRPPLGYFVYQHGQTEVANGAATFMTLYHYDFVDGSDILNVHGRDQLAKIALLLPQTFFPIVIERTPEAPFLAESRRVAILNELAQGKFPVPPQRVVIGPSLGDDLRGVEAQVFNFGVMFQDQRGVLMGGMGMGGTGGMAGGGGIGGGGFGGIGGGGFGGMGGTGGMGGMGGMGMGGMGMGGMGMGLGR